MINNNFQNKIFNNNSICISFKKNKKETEVIFYNRTTSTNSNGFLYYKFNKLASVPIYRVVTAIKDNCTGYRYSESYDKFEKNEVNDDIIHNNEDDVFVDGLLYGIDESFVNVTIPTNVLLTEVFKDDMTVSKYYFKSEDNITFGKYEFKNYPYVDEYDNFTYIMIFDNLLSFYFFIIYKYYLEDNKKKFKYCKYCGKKFTPKKRSDTLYCSKLCQTTASKPSVNRIYGIYKYYRDYLKRYIEPKDEKKLKLWASQINEIRLLCEQITNRNTDLQNRLEYLQKLNNLGYIIPINEKKYKSIDEIFAYRNNNKDIMLNGEPTDEDVQNWFYQFIRNEWKKLSN